MPVPCYFIRDECPPLSVEDDRGPFWKHREAWRALGLFPVINGARGNATLIPYVDGQLLVVWPDGTDAPLPYPPRGPNADPNAVWFDVDDTLAVGWMAGPDGGGPSPEDLDNGNPLKLTTCGVLLADGHVWEVPEIRNTHGSMLPRDLVRDRKTGAFSSPVKREHEQLWMETEFWFNLLWDGLEGRAATFQLERAVEYATRVLALRYRFADATQSAIRVIDSTNVLDIIRASVSWDAVLEVLREITDGEQQKKSAL